MLVVDTDPGIDDALALLLAARAERPIELVTAVGGNVPVDRAARNAQGVCDVLDIGAPVRAGADLDVPRDGPDLHGSDGLGGAAPASDPSTVAAGAADALCDAAASDTDLVSLGPLTNLAAALDEDPEVLDRFRSVTVMGGAVWTYGNVTRASEFNIWADPAAARRVLDAPGTLRLVPVNVCRTITLAPAGAGSLPDPFDRMAGGYVEFYRERGYPGGVLYDPLAMLLALHPDLCGTVDRDIAVEPRGELTRGMTVPEEREGLADPNVAVVNSIDRDGIVDRMRTLYGIEEIHAAGARNL